MPRPRPRQATRAEAILETARRAYAGELPERYWNYPASFRAPFERVLETALAPGQRILDVGGGRSPTLGPDDRPPGSHYVGFDVCRRELERAPQDAYDEIVDGDVTEEMPELKEGFDLIVSFQALEHVKGTDQAFDNMRSYLRPGGRLVAQLSATFSVYALINRVTPQPLTRRIQARLYNRPPDTVFPAHYDLCWFSALERITAPWSSAEIAPLWIAEPYLHFSRPLRAAYIAYEEWARLGDRRNLAPYYLIHAIR